VLGNQFRKRAFQNSSAAWRVIGSKGAVQVIVAATRLDLVPDLTEDRRGVLRAVT